MFNQIFNFIKKTVKATVNSIKDIIIDIIDNAEAVLLLVFASLGLTTLYAELPYITLVSAWMEVSAFIPILSVLTIMILIISMSNRPKIIYN